MAMKFPPPDYMGKWSKGPMVNPVLDFLARWAEKNGHANHHIVLNGEYGATAFIWMRRYHESKGIDTADGCGPQTRAAMLKDDFDFEQAASKLGKCITLFVQPKGRPPIFWAPDTAAHEGGRLDRAYLLEACYRN